MREGVERGRGAGRREGEKGGFVRLCFFVSFVCVCLSVHMTVRAFIHFIPLLLNALND